MKSSPRALDAPGLGLNTSKKRTDKERTDCRQGIQIGRSSSRALESTKLDINVFVKRIDEDTIGFR